MFAELLSNPGLAREIVLALAAGVLSFVSACSLPLLAGVTAYITSTAWEADRGPGVIRKAVPGQIIVLILSFATMFVLLGLPASHAGRWVSVEQGLVRRLGGVAAVLVGGQMAGVETIRRLAARINLARTDGRPGLVLAGLIGLGMAGAWNPCPGRVLTSILILGGAEGQMEFAAALLAAHAVGFGLILLLSALAWHHLVSLLHGPSTPARVLRLAGAVTLIIWGVTVFFDWLGPLTPRGPGVFAV
ncbi:MAG: cytochrome c biogenesis protein CcdA [Thermodesulfobacteriota bacterium]